MLDRVVDCRQRVTCDGRVGMVRIVRGRPLLASDHYDGRETAEHRRLPDG